MLFLFCIIKVTPVEEFLYQDTLGLMFNRERTCVRKKNGIDDCSVRFF